MDPESDPVHRGGSDSDAGDTTAHLAYVMPNKVVTVHRWQAVGVLALVTLSYVLGLFLLKHDQVTSDKVQEKINVRLCTQTVENRDATRRTWTAAQNFVTQGTTTPEGRERTELFFQAILATIPPLRCDGANPVEIK